MAGTLYIVATPIGNLDDMPPRVAATFGAADFIAAEDTRVTMKLLNFLGLKKPMVSYYEHALQKGEGILRRIEAGESCALCSDAGMPCVSDPGEVIVRDALARGIKVVPVPAASACVTALAVSGQDTSRRRPIEKKGSEFELDVDTVIMSLGTSPNPLIRSTTPGLETNKHGCIVTDGDDGKTSRDGVYAGGDAVTGAATVIKAMGAGKAAAKAIDEYIQSK